VLKEKTVSAINFKPFQENGKNNLNDKEMLKEEIKDILIQVCFTNLKMETIPVMLETML
jgi:NTP pyrophosphatase (non-canonical NTP hydrolase)